MVKKLKYPANDALKVIHGPLSDELRLFRFDLPNRTKARLFGVGGRQGRQFGIILGDIDVATMRYSASKTIIVLERCDLPSISGLEPYLAPVRSHRLQQRDSKICPEDQTSCMVADETALLALLRWYSR